MQDSTISRKNPHILGPQGSERSPEGLGDRWLGVDMKRYDYMKCDM